MEVRRHPDKAIIFVHGIHDFRRLRFLWPPNKYFRRIRELMASKNIVAYFPKLPNGGSVRDRSRVLAEFLEHVDETELHLIAHSMGGLDARNVILNFDEERRIRSLTTIATPHRGTAIATWAIQTNGLIQSLARWLMLRGLECLTPEACAAFNEVTPNRDDVRYTSFAGSRPPEELPLALRRFGKIMQDAEGPNDGVVSVASARWDNFSEPIRADHAEAVGWNLGWPHTATKRPFDHEKLYESVVSMT